MQNAFLFSLNKLHCQSYKRTHKFKKIKHNKKSLRCPMLDRWGHEGLQAKVPLGVAGRHAGHVVELARLGDLRLGRQHDRFGGLLLGLALSARRRQGNVLRVADQLLDAHPHLASGLVRVEAEADHLAVVCRQTHGVEGGRGHLVVREIVDGVLPEGETGAPLGEHEAHAGCAPGPGAALVVQQHRNSGVHQAPVLLADALVQVGQRRADVHLRSQPAEEALDLGPLKLRDHPIVQTDQIVLAVLVLCVILFVDVVPVQALLLLKLLQLLLLLLMVPMMMVMVVVVMVMTMTSGTAAAGSVGATATAGVAGLAGNRL
uniref:(northern house mosquito) hypothetical protein n=1 Tax=Culex pipiens TaxID=7175 RepID=A0A8D8BPT4_CULPI